MAIMDGTDAVEHSLVEDGTEEMERMPQIQPLELMAEVFLESLSESNTVSEGEIGGKSFIVGLSEVLGVAFESE